MTDRRRLYQRIAPFYDILDFAGEALNQRKVRPQLLDGLRGRVLDAGIGTGRNIPYYPPNATVVGTDLSSAMQVLKIAAIPDAVAEAVGAAEVGSRRVGETPARVQHE